MCGTSHRDLTRLAHDGARPCILDEEIAKCEVVCAACHRLRSAARRPPRRWFDPTVERNLAFLSDALSAATCADCGQRDAMLLDFDHRGAKTAGVKMLAWHGAPLDALLAEIARCEVRCVNCHRRRTARVRGHYRYVATRTPL